MQEEALLEDAPPKDIQRPSHFFLQEREHREGSSLQDLTFHCIAENKSRELKSERAETTMPVHPGLKGLEIVRVGN